MAGLDDVLAEYQRQIKGAVELTAKERAQITKAGADVFRDKLEETNRELHRSRTGKNHMSDHISSVNKTLEKVLDGTSTVAWDDAHHAANARRLNDGTKFYTADHWVEHVRTESMPEVLAAEHAEYQKILKKRGF